jgi:D-xylose transport system substrate-binding protein
MYIPSHHKLAREGRPRASVGRLAGSAAVAASLLLVSACGNGDADETDTAAGEATGGGEETDGEQADGDLVIGVAMKTQVQRRWGFDVAAMEEKADELGVSLIVQWANDDTEAQTGQIENLLSQGADALIVTPVDSQAAGASVQTALNEGIPVVAYDIGIEGVPVDSFVIRDNPKVGVLQAEGALEFAPEGNYAIIGGDPANDVAQGIHDGVLETLEGEAPEIVYDQFTANWDPSTAVAEAENILTSNSDDIQAFVTANDGMATGVIQVLKGRNLDGEVYVSGLDADPANLQFIDEGAQTMSVWTQIDEQGSIAVETAVALARGEEIEAETTVDNGSGEPIPARVAPVVAITKDNLCEFINEIAPEGWVTAEEVFDDANACD